MSPERYQRIREVLAKRQTDLTVCLENVHKPHNIAAVIRTCDAIGIHQVHTSWEQQYSMRRGTAMGAQNWVRTTNHGSVETMLDTVKQQGMQVLVTHLSEKAVDFRDIDYTKPTAILFGQEKYGATDTAIEMADQDIVIPMVGMVQSLNVSVAAALVLYEAQRQRQLAGFYDTQHLPEDECQRVLFEGGYPTLVKVCQRKGIEYPYIDAQGQIDAPDSWWQAMQMSAKALAEMDDDSD